MTDAPIRILMLGDFATAEMQPVDSMLGRWAPSADVRSAGNVDALASLVNDDGWYADLVIVAQHWPDEFTPADVTRLLELLPLARWVCCRGAWCESDGHNRSVWPAACCVFARCAETRIRAELAVLETGQAALPLTASRDEVFAHDHTGGWSVCENDAPVLVIGPDRRYRQMLRDVLASAGFVVTDSAVPIEQNCQFVVWDTDPWSPELSRSIAAFRASNPRAFIVAPMNFAHAETVAQALASGVDRVLAKLDDLSRLTDALREHDPQSVSRPELSP